jgi:hypothetical protein
MSIQVIIHDTVAGLFAGLLSVFLVIYAFQPNRPYPSWVLEPAERPWIFIMIFIAIWFLFKWDYLVGVLAILCILAVVLDLMVFARMVPEKTQEGLYVPSISLVPGLDKILTEEEMFENQKVVPVTLTKEEQVSKRWTINTKPDPYMLRINNYVDSSDVYTLGGASGMPLGSDILKGANNYPLF